MSWLDPLSSYQTLLVESIQARAHDDAEVEDRLGDQLDSLWYRLTQDQKVLAKEFASRMAVDYLDGEGNVLRTPQVLDSYSGVTQQVANTLQVFSIGEKSSLGGAYSFLMVKKSPPKKVPNRTAKTAVRKRKRMSFAYQAQPSVHSYNVVARAKKSTETFAECAL